jgi:hypothetical protein
VTTAHAITVQSNRANRAGTVCDARGGGTGQVWWRRAQRAGGDTYNGAHPDTNLVQNHHLGVANEGDGHTQLPLHATTQGRRQGVCLPPKKGSKKTWVS